jgi:ribosomal subunit interface protein
LKSNNEPLLLQCRGFESSPALAQRVALEHKKLARIAPAMTRCRVTISKTHRHQHQGCPYEVHLELIIPGAGEIVAARNANEDVYVALKDAFAALHQQLEKLTGLRHDRSRARGAKRELSLTQTFTDREA